MFYDVLCFEPKIPTKSIRNSLYMWWYKDVWSITYHPRMIGLFIGLPWFATWLHVCFQNALPNSQPTHPISAKPEGGSKHETVKKMCADCRQQYQGLRCRQTAISCLVLHFLDRSTAFQLIQGCIQSHGSTSWSAGLPWKGVVEGHP